MCGGELADYPVCKEFRRDVWSGSRLATVWGGKSKGVSTERCHDTIPKEYPEIRKEIQEKMEAEGAVIDKTGRYLLEQKYVEMIGG